MGSTIQTFADQIVDSHLKDIINYPPNKWGTRIFSLMREVRKIISHGNISLENMYKKISSQKYSLTLKEQNKMYLNDFIDDEKDTKGILKSLVAATTSGILIMPNIKPKRGYFSIKERALIHERHLVFGWATQDNYKSSTISHVLNPIIDKMNDNRTTNINLSIYSSSLRINKYFYGKYYDRNKNINFSNVPQIDPWFLSTRSKAKGPFAIMYESVRRFVGDLIIYAIHDRHSLLRHLEPSITKNNLIEEISKQQLMAIETNWSKFLLEAEQMRKSTALRAFKGLSPIEEYKIEISLAFNSMVANTRFSMASNILNHSYSPNESLEPQSLTFAKNFEEIIRNMRSTNE